MEMIYFSAKITSRHVTIESPATTAPDSRSPALPFAPAVAVSHAIVTDGRAALQLYTRPTPKLQRRDAREWPHAHHLQLTKSRRRRQRRRMVLLYVYIPELSLAQQLRAVRYASCPGYYNHFKQLSSFATE